MAVTRPVNLQIPFANSGSKNTIPVPSQIGVTAGAASFTDGFPPLTFTPLASGGVQPAGADFNGIFNILSQHIVFANAGGRYRFDAALATAIGGYPVGFVLQDDAGLNSYVNILASNSTNFNSSPSSIGVSWIPYAGQAATQSGANIYAVGGGTANAQTATYVPAITALTDGMVLWFKAAAANTGATTLNVNGLGASPVVGAAHSALQGGEIIANGRCMVVWNATLASWVLIECTGGALQVAPATKSNQAVNLGQFSNSLAAPVFQQFPSGLIIQIGSAVVTNTRQTFSVPIAFPNNFFLIVGTYSNQSVPSATAQGNTYSTGLSTFSAIANRSDSSSAGMTFNYIAIGN